MRTYGLREELYRQARQLGVHFLRYDPDQGLVAGPNGDGLAVRLTDTTLNREVELRPDLLVLATAIMPAESQSLAQMFKLSVSQEGFFQEAHVKLRPVDFATDGVYLAGLAHSPKPIEESIAQAQAAAARAAVLLSREGLDVGGAIAEINKSLCAGCGMCVEVCPYQAISLDENGKAEVNSAVCKGCGTCAASCRSGAPSLGGFTDQAIFEQVAACFC